MRVLLDSTHTVYSYFKKCVQKEGFSEGFQLRDQKPNGFKIRGMYVSNK